MLYARCASQFVEMIFQTRSTLAIENILLLFTHHYPETYKPKFHCRRQSGMNFGYVTVNKVNSNIAVVYTTKHIRKAVFPSGCVLS